MRQNSQKAVVAGHICLDMIPAFDRTPRSLYEVLKPGNLVQIGPAVTSTGGAVSNTGIALHKLGMGTNLMGKVGNDSFGRDVLQILDRIDPDLSKAMIVDEGAHTSYSIIISPPGIDRIFLHHPGANHTFCQADVDDRLYHGGSLFHFGYPPFMERMASEDGKETVQLLQRVKRNRLTTSLDMAKPDPDDMSGSIDWNRFLLNVLPYVDVFLPSIEELWYMLEPNGYERWVAQTGGQDITPHVDGDMLYRLSSRLLDMGAAVVAIKLGDQGLYVRTTEDVQRIRQMGKSAPSNPGSWAGKEYLSPCYQVEVVGTTGAGDCTIAGFLAGMMSDWSLEQTMTVATAVGACNVEAADAVSGIRSLPQVLDRINRSWKRCPVNLPLPGWQWNEQYQLYVKE
jgi:sugar/nucleoside kinase (ribokinase family)